MSTSHGFLKSASWPRLRPPPPKRGLPPGAPPAGMRQPPPAAVSRLGARAAAASRLPRLRSKPRDSPTLRGAPEGLRPASPASGPEARMSVAVASAARARDAKRPARSAEDAAQQAARPQAATTGSPLEGADGQAEGCVAPPRHRTRSHREGDITSLCLAARGQANGRDRAAASDNAHYRTRRSAATSPAAPRPVATTNLDALRLGGQGCRAARAGSGGRRSRPQPEHAARPALPQVRRSSQLQSMNEISRSS